MRNVFIYNLIYLIATHSYLYVITNKYPQNIMRNECMYLYIHNIEYYIVNISAPSTRKCIMLFDNGI